MPDGKDGIKEHQRLIPPELCREGISLVMALLLASIKQVVS